MAWLIIPGLMLGGVTTDVWSAQDAPTQKPTISGTAETAPSVLYGVVRSAKDQKSLAGVPIHLENTSNGQIISKTTDQQGAFIFSNLPPGDYKVRVGGGMFSVQQKEGLLKGGTVGEMNFAVTQLSQGASEIVGSIYEGHEGHKIPLAAKVAVENVKTKEVYQVNADSTGIFSLKNIPSGNYIIQATKEGYLPYSQEIAVRGKTSEEIRLRINRMARASIKAIGDKKIHDTTGAISVVSQKKFQQNLTTGATYTLMQNTPGIEYYSRSGGEGISGGMNFMSCRGYTVGGANTSPIGVSGIELSVEGVPMNIEADGGEIYDLGIMNTDVKSATVNRGVTTSRETGSYAAGCSINFHLVDPSEEAYQTINSGGGSYGLYYTSYVNNSGISKTNNVGAYNDFTILHQDGFQEFTPLTEYQYYGNITKYLTGGRMYFIATANYKNYDRGASISLDNFNTYGPTFNGGPSFGNPGNPGATTPNAPFYKNWSYGRFMLDLGFKDQITPNLRIKNSLYANVEPNGDTSMPVGFNNSTVSSSNLQPAISPNYSSQLGYQFVQNYYQAEGFKAGDIGEIKYHLFQGDDVYLGMKGQYATYHYYILPLAESNQVGGTINAQYSQTSIVGYLENHYKPVKQVLFNAGFRIASIDQYFNDLVPTDQQANYKASQVGPSVGASMLIPMPHVGLNIYPTDNWKIYVNGGQSFAPPAIFAYKGLGAGGLGGAGLAPENVWDLSAGFRYSQGDNFAAIDAFSDFINNMPIPVVFNTGTTQYTQYENIGAARQQGIEFDAKYVIGWGFSTEANFTYMSAVLGNSPVNGPGTQPNFMNDMVPYVPMDMGNIAVSYDHGPYHLSADERFTGVMNIIDFSGGPSGTGNPQIMVPAYWVTDLHASYDIPPVKGWWKSANIYVDAYNLFNTNYYNPAGFAANANNIETLFVYPGEPVNIFAGAKFTF